MPKKINLSGSRFGILKVISFQDHSTQNKRRWLCLCDCGKKTVVIGADMVQGKQISCGSCQQCLKEGWTLNIRWATHKQQTINRRCTVILNLKGVSRPISDWSYILGIPRDVIWQRVKRLGWSDELALTIPKERRSVRI